MKNVIFTRQRLTAEQLEKIGEVHIDASDLASRTIESLKDAQSIYLELLKRVDGHVVVNLYGVIPTPLRHIMYVKNTPLSVYEEFNFGWLRVH